MSDKTYKYTVSLQGYGGEFSAIPLTPEQARFWRDRGDEAMASHLAMQGETDDDVPLESQLPDYRDQGRNFISGICPDSGLQLTVEDADGNPCLELDSDSTEFMEMQNFTREIGPSDGQDDGPVVMFRTFVKGADVYRITSERPFDASLLKLEAAEVAKCGDVIFAVTYDGGQVEFVEGADRETQEPVAVLIEAAS